MSAIVGIFALLAGLSGGGVAVNVEVQSTVVLNGDGSAWTNASEHPLILTYPTVIDGVVYSISMVS